MSQDGFLPDFCKTLNQPGCVVELAKEWGAKGSSHFKVITPEIIKEAAQIRQNIGILGSVTQREFGTGRAGKDDIKAKSYVAFDLDLKDSIPDFKTWAKEEKESHVKKLFEDKKQAIEACGLGSIWIASYSGNGLHLWFRAFSPIKIDSPKNYEGFYLECVSRLEKALVCPFDKACKDQNRLMRLPQSWNIKDPSNPIKTGEIYHNEAADSSIELHGLWENTVKMEQANNVIPLPLPTKSFFSKAAHKEAVKEAITFEEILIHFGYSKMDTIIRKGDTLTISSPWNSDATPSCFLHNDTKKFKDFSSENGGDTLDFIAYLWKLDVKKDFRKVFKIAEEITGITEPKSNKETGEEKAKDEEITKEDYYKLFKKVLPDLCRDILTGQMFFKEKDGAWAVAMNALPWVEALGSEIGLKMPLIGRWLTYYGRDELKARLLVDIPKWDEIDRVKEISKCLHLKQDTGLTQEHFEDYLKQWGSKIFEKLGDNSVQNESEILLLVGGQGIGKDRLIYSLVGGLGRHYSEGTIGRKENDDYQLAAQSLVINLSEFDQTARTDIGYLKDFITKKEVTLRKPYAREPETLSLRHSLIASSNEGDLLRDSTGNRRFAQFEIERIDWSYPTDQSLQILAQFKASMKHRVSPESKAAMDTYIKEKTPPTIQEQVLDVFDNLMRGSWANNSDVLKHHEAHGIIAEVAKTVRILPIRVTTILSKNNRSRTGTGRRREVYLPENAPK